MLRYLFYKPIPIAELEAELLSFARLVADDGYDTISGMVVVVHPTLCGEPYELRWRGSDVPTTAVHFESRLASPKPTKSQPRSARERDRADSDD